MLYIGFTMQLKVMLAKTIATLKTIKDCGFYQSLELAVLAVGVT